MCDKSGEIRSFYWMNTMLQISQKIIELCQTPHTALQAIICLLGIMGRVSRRLGRFMNE